MADFSQTSAFISPIHVSSPRPHLFALLIGINEYEAAEFISLRGAVADALEFKDYLISQLNVPSSQISVLLGKEASRSAIIDAFRDLQFDPRIEKGDPIFIFFAGHGSELPSPPSWVAGGAESKLQVIVPQDYRKHPAPEIRPILDRTLGALLKGIADKKGNNITVVFDCCHAASGTRGPPENNLSMTLTRSVELECTIPEDLDQDLWDTATRGVCVPPGYQHAGLNSHVLLAACGAGEKAKETQGRGEFSTALLTLLRTIGPDKLKYPDILHRIDQIPSQNPQCEGINRNRYLFDGKVLPSTRPCYAIQRQDNGSIIMKAGSAHGVTERAIFTVYPNSDSTHERPLGDFVVNTLSHFSSIMAPASGSSSYFFLPLRAVAVQTEAGVREVLRLYIRPQDDSLVSLVRKSIKRGLSNVAVMHVEHGRDAHLAISLDKEKVVFRVTDPNATRHGFRQQFDLDYAEFRGDPKRLSNLLKGVAHYYWLLYQIHNQYHQQVTNSIQVEFYQLHEVPSIEYSENSELFPFGPNLCNDNRIEFFAEEDCAYGMKLTNRGPYDFFPYVFYFDNSDLTVDMDYEPPTSGPFKSDVPLKKAGGNLTIGYGAGGSQPRTYLLRRGQNVEVGFFKVLISTKPLGDLSHLTQKMSPFTGMHQRGSGRGDWKKRDIEIWGTLILPIICHRRVPSRHGYQPSIGPHHIYGGPSTSSARHPQDRGEEIIGGRKHYQLLQQVSDKMSLAL